MLCYMIVYFVLLMTAVKVQAQCERPNMSNNRILIDETNRQTFSDGDTVKFKCAVGYASAGGGRTITCTGTEWSELELKCKKKTCGNAGSIMNGKYQYVPDVLFGATATAVCDEGYLLIGKETRTCRETGWDGRDPVCEAIQCETPPSITNGRFEPDQEFYNYGEVVIYSCRNNLNLIGESEITCSAGGFHPSPPQCLDVSCEKPDIQNAIRVEGKSPPYKYQNFVRYKCEEGYRMNGSDHMTCKENGWVPPPPRCNVITCPTPSPIPNGTIVPVKDLYIYKETVTFSCNRCFNLKGPSTAKCSASGFDGHPECKEVTCQLPNIPHLFVSGSSQIYECDSSVQVSCDNGYRLQGPESLTCGERGWSLPRPQCNAILCEQPNVPHLTVSDSSPPYRWNVTVRVSCDEGYRIQGPDYLTCGENGWNPPLPKCIIIPCSAPSPLPSGTFVPVKDLYVYGETVTFSCNRCFKLQGPSTAKCTANGLFDRHPECKEVTCQLPNIPHLFVSESSQIYECDSSVQVSCDNGYRLQGPESLTCGERGWSLPRPQCNAILCEHPNIPHLTVSDGSPPYRWNVPVRVSCVSGYRLQGPDYLTCGEHGWILPLPQCHALTCQLPQIENGFINDNSILFDYKSEIQVQCNTGYSMEGHASLTCDDHGWNPPPPLCHSNQIGILLGVFFGLALLVTCLVGYMRCYKQKKNGVSKSDKKPEDRSLFSMNNDAPPPETSASKNTLL